MSEIFEREDRSKYAGLFSALRSGKHDGEWVMVDRVKGGGLATRLKAKRYVGLDGLDYQVRQKRCGDEQQVFIKITPRGDDDGRTG